MASFTMYLREVVESIYGTSLDPDEYEQPFSEIEANGVKYGRLPILDDYSKIGLGTYPIFDEAYRPVLNGKIIDEYWNQEIGVETIDEFIRVMRKKLDQIMPYYNQFYESEKISYNPITTMDIRTESESELEGNETTTGTTTAKSKTDTGSRNINSNFPQTMLKGDADYASSGTDINSDSEVDSEGSQSGESNNKSTNKSDNHVTGYQGIPSELLMRHRATFLNIDTQIIAELQECFMMVYTSGDEFFTFERNGRY